MQSITMTPRATGAVKLPAAAERWPGETSPLLWCGWVVARVPQLRPEGALQANGFVEISHQHRREGNARGKPVQSEGEERLESTPQGRKRPPAAARGGDQREV